MISPNEVRRGRRRYLPWMRDRDVQEVLSAGRFELSARRINRAEVHDDRVHPLDAHPRLGPVMLAPDRVGPTTRAAALWCARAFKRELSFNGVHYSIEENPEDRAVVVVAEDRDGSYRGVGAARFRWRADQWTLDWAWLHPHVRHRGIARAAWSYVAEQFGDFSICGPLSPAGRRVVEKMGAEHRVIRDRRHPDHSGTRRAEDRSVPTRSI